jgi:tetraacyldisaccharide 4'-kinase
MITYIYSLATDKKKGSAAGAIKCFLFFFSLIYSLVVGVLIFIYRIKPCRLGCKVISVGNITLGGTGKTSLVLLIARYLKQNGHKVAILTRGYKRRNISRVLQGDGYESMGDEPYMLKMNLKDVPVIVDSDRIRAAKSAIQDYGVDTVILDDGMQQWRIKKDLEIVSIDSVLPFGNRHLIPRGILREPLSSLKRADIFVLTKTNLANNINDVKSSLNKFNPGALVSESVHEAAGLYDINEPGKLLSLSQLKGKSAVLFSGIGDPYSFTKLISVSGIKVGLDFRFADHYNYSVEDLSGIIGRCIEKKSEVIITTEKDASRLSDEKLAIFKGHRLLVLRIELKIIKNEEKFISRLLGLYSL